MGLDTISKKKLSGPKQLTKLLTIYGISRKSNHPSSTQNITSGLNRRLILTLHNWSSTFCHQFIVVQRAGPGHHPTYLEFLV